uniref:Uncharacterized protein n=1 Tax=Globodera rostochiensis TaxID=31243 RepID=A0A914HSB7_GLORO
MNKIVIFHWTICGSFDLFKAARRIPSEELRLLRERSAELERYDEKSKKMELKEEHRTRARKCTPPRELEHQKLLIAHKFSTNKDGTVSEQTATD